MYGNWISTLYSLLQVLQLLLLLFGVSSVDKTGTLLAVIVKGEVPLTGPTVYNVNLTAMEFVPVVGVKV